MHFKVYAPATLPNADTTVIVTQEAHVQEGNVTGVGWAHFVFFGVMFAIIVNEAFFSKNPPPGELWATAAIVIALLIVGNHMVLGIVKQMAGLVEYQGDPLRSVIGWSTVLGGAAAAIAICIARTVYHLW